MNIDNLLGTEDGTQKPNIRLLTVTFFLCVFFASTQDVVVDGWSLTFLQKWVSLDFPSFTTVGSRWKWEKVIQDTRLAFDRVNGRTATQVLQKLFDSMPIYRWSSDEYFIIPHCRKNIGYSAHCQSIGMSLGFFLAYVGFIILDSKDFCNIFRSTPRDYGFVSFAGE